MRHLPASSAASRCSAGRPEMSENNTLTHQAFFAALADELCTKVDGADRVTLYLRAEDSDFIRFNRAAVRQATHVNQGYATVAIVRGARRIEFTCSLTGHLASDTTSLLADRAELLAQLADVPEDPYLLLPDDVTSSSRHESGT